MSTDPQAVIRQGRMISRAKAELARSWLEKWLLSLAIGHGTASLGVAAALMSDAGVPWRNALVLAGWLFFLGLIASALIPLAFAYREHSDSKLSGQNLPSLEAMLAAQDNKTFFAAMSEQVPFKPMHFSFTRRLPVMLGVLSALLFILGVATPLVSLTLWPQPVQANGS